MAEQIDCGCGLGDACPLGTTPAAAPTPVELKEFEAPCDDKDCAHPYCWSVRAPAESQGVERVQPVEGPREPIYEECRYSPSGKHVMPHGTVCRYCEEDVPEPVEGPRGTARRIERIGGGFEVDGIRIAELSDEQLLSGAAGDYRSMSTPFAGVQSAFAEAWWRRHPDSPTCSVCGDPIYWFEGPPKALWAHLIGSHSDHPAAPVEGVERVTDDAPARVEPTWIPPVCIKCKKPLDSYGSVRRCRTDGFHCIWTPAAQPAKHTDDRPTETIPRYRIDSDGALEASEYGMVVTYPDHLFDLRRAETRIEVLEAALVRLRDCDWVISLPDRMDAVRDIARAALAAPSGEKAP